MQVKIKASMYQREARLGPESSSLWVEPYALLIVSHLLRHKVEISPIVWFMLTEGGTGCLLGKPEKSLTIEAHH